MNYNKIEEELATLYMQQELINKRIHRLCQARRKLREAEDVKYISRIPKDNNLITEEQWSWILWHDHDSESGVRYKYCTNKLRDMGFDAFGFHPETKQWSLTLMDVDRAKNSFDILSKYIKPVTNIDARWGTDTGIRINVPGLKEDMISVLYVHCMGDVTLYLSTTDKKTFPSFDAFIDFYIDDMDRMED